MVHNSFWGSVSFLEEVCFGIFAEILERLPWSPEVPPAVAVYQSLQQTRYSPQVILVDITIVTTSITDRTKNLCELFPAICYWKLPR